ncbi:Transmembrane_domain-containing protein [Hexamita inflata]|uniref:Transmembrane domain-containing protein n=1 Tax=Hexamita inflata TaxID=28002 RepID=A0AA86V569_9EUKA|nr:Transmembrane domain-containing protein [Hexamita inflata]
MSDRLYYGNFFFEDTPISVSLIVIYMFLSLFPSMFQVSSLLLLQFDNVFDKNEWWRPFSAVFTCNHPDTFILILFLLYVSRVFEFYNGSVAYFFQIILSIIFSALPFLILGAFKDKFDYFYGRYIVEYTLALPVSLSIAGVISQFKVNNWKAKISEKIQVPQGFGYVLVLFLAACHRFAPESAIIVVWSCAMGAILSLITKKTCGKFKKQAVK